MGCVRQKLKGKCPCVQVVWNSKMREEVLAQMEAARADPEKAGSAQDFRFEALQVDRLFAVSMHRVSITCTHA